MLNSCAIVKIHWGCACTHMFLLDYLENFLRIFEVMLLCVCSCALKAHGFKFMLTLCIWLTIELNCCVFVGIHWRTSCALMILLALTYLAHSCSYVLCLCKWALWSLPCVLGILLVLSTAFGKFLFKLCTILASMAPKKCVKTTAASTSRAPAARGNSSLPYIINKDNIVFVDAEHASRYDAIVTRKLSAPSYLDRQILDITYFYDDVQGCIRFRLFNATHAIHLIRFNELLHLPPFGTLILDHENYTTKSFGTPSLVRGSHMRHSSPRPPWFAILSFIISNA